MATNPLGLAFEIIANPAGAEAAIQQFEQATGHSLNKVNEHMKKSEGVVQEFTDFFKSHLIFSVDEFIRLGRDSMEMMKSSAEFGEQVANLSEATGMSAEQVSGLEFAMKQTGVQADTLDRATRELARNLSPLASSGSEGGKALKALGLSATDATGHMKPLHEQLLEIADAFHKTKDSTEKSAAAAAIFGTRVGSEMIPFLNRGRVGILAMEAAARQLGVTLNDKDARSLREMNEQLKLNDARLEGVKLRISEAIMPEFMALSNLLTGDSTSWKIWADNIQYYEAKVLESTYWLLTKLPKVGKYFQADFEAIKRGADDLGTEALLLQQKQDDLMKAFEGGLKGHGEITIPGISNDKGAALAAKRAAHEQEMAAHKAALAAIHAAHAEDVWNKSIHETELRSEKLAASIAAHADKNRAAQLKSLQAGLSQGPPSNPLLNPAFMQGQQMLLKASQEAVPAFSRNTEAVENFKAALTGTQGSLTQFSEKFKTANQISLQFSDAMGKNIAQAIIFGGSIDAAMEKALKATIASIAAKAIVNALYSTALGFLLLAEMDYPGAASAFEAAAAFGLVGGAAAAIGAAIPGGASGRQGRNASPRYEAGGGSGGHHSGSGSGAGEEWNYGAMSSMALASGAQGAAQPSGALTVAIMGDEQAGQWLATTLNRGVTQQGVQLTSSSSQRGTPVGH